MKRSGWKVIVSCEHGGNQVPPTYQQLFLRQEQLLASHRGYDAGALPLAEAIAGQLGAPLFFSEQTRLLVDLNRSLGHTNLFGEQLKNAERQVKDAIVNEYYLPYRNAVRDAVAAQVALNVQVVHLSIHSFTPVFDGQQRLSDVGLLYDPARYQEKSLCRRWRKELLLSRLLTVRFNWPYRGIADGLVRSLRREFAEEQYLGIEVEINQGLLQGNGRFPEPVCQAVVSSLERLLVTQHKAA